ncbi:MAG: penicillin-binding transpeptidase domain-containing protein, partial [Acidobacteria bacterium]|nr:penicillin-binding transpeptidase domain-containing protein [Acidobacteriota bacterium]
CHLKTGHGTVDIHKGIMASCDVFFYNVGNRLGIDRIAEYAELSGLGRKTGIDLPNEAEGTVPSSKWKLRNQRQKWYAGETISVSIGQGALTVSPLQLAAAIGGIADGGRWMRPHTVKSAGGSTQFRQGNLNPENLAKVIYGMFGVVNEGGTGTRARLVGLDVCGKTGTAQLASNQFLKGKTAKNLKDNAWFVGFAPRAAPEVVVVALFENGEHGPAAAPIVRDVIKAHFDKKARLNKTYRASTSPPTLPAALLGVPTVPVQAATDPATSADPKNQEIVEVRD